MPRGRNKELAIVEPVAPSDADLTNSGRVVSTAQENGAVAYLSPEGYKALHNEPKSLSNFEDLRRSFGTPDVVEESVPLLNKADRFEAIRFLPAYHPALVAKYAGKLSLEDERTGRITDIAASYPINDGMNSSGNQLVTGMDSDWCKGKDWMQARIRQAKETGDYTVLLGRGDQGITSMNAIFTKDVTAQHIHHDRGFPYTQLREWKFRGLVASPDVNPVDGWVETLDEKDGMVSGMLSDRLTLDDERAELLGQIPGRTETDRLKVIRESMAGFGAFAADLKANAKAGDEANRKDREHEADFDKMWERRYKIIKNQSPAAARLMGTYRDLVKGDPYKIRIAAKAWREMEAVTRFGTNYHAIHNKNIPTQVVNKLRQRQDNIDNEYLQAFTMAMQISKIQATLSNDGPKQLNPIRAMFNGFDNYDYHWASMLGFINAGERGKISQKYADTYANPINKQLRFHANPTTGNNLWFSRRHESLHHWNPQEKELGGMTYRYGQDMMYKSEGGATAADYIDSLYDLELPNTMPGIIGRFSIMGDAMNYKRIDGIFVDCLEAPAIIMRNLVERGLLDTGKNTVDRNDAPYLSQIFGDPWLDERPHNILLGKRDGNDFTVEGTIKERESITVISTKLADGTIDLSLADNELKEPSKKEIEFTLKHPELEKNQSIVTDLTIVNAQPHMGRQRTSGASILLMASLEPPRKQKVAKRTYDASGEDA